MLSKITVAAAIIHFLVSIFYFIMATRLSQLYTDLAVPQPNILMKSWPSLLFLFFVIIDIVYYKYLKEKAVRGPKGNNDRLYSLLLVILPFIILSSIFYFLGLVANNYVKQTINSIK